MRPYKLTDMSNRTVDLDDVAIYAHLPSTRDELDDRMWKNIGFALSYMDYMNRESFPMDCAQRIRVTHLVARFCREGHEERGDGTLKRSDPQWLREQVFVFEDEIENMC
jgi:hypothetical protein